MVVNEALRILRTVRYDAAHFSVFLQAGTIAAAGDFLAHLAG